MHNVYVCARMCLCNALILCVSCRVLGQEGGVHDESMSRTIVCALLKQVSNLH
jgi:hypothetical protein